MDVTDDDVENLRRISEKVFENSDHIEVQEVRDTDGDVMVKVKEPENNNSTMGVRNAFGGDNLRQFHDHGYVAVAVGGGNKNHSAWFERADTLEFGDPTPSGGYDLFDGWRAVVGDGRLTVQKDDDVVAHVAREGWTLDGYVLHYVLPSKVTARLKEHGFERGDVSLK